MSVGVVPDQVRFQAGELGRGDLVEALVPDQGPQDVDPAAGEGDHGLGVAFPLGVLAVVADASEGCGGSDGRAWLLIPRRR